MATLGRICIEAQEEALRRPEVARALCDELAERVARRIILLGLPSAMREPHIKAPVVHAGIMVLTPPAHQTAVLERMVRKAHVDGHFADEDVAYFRTLVAEGAEHGVDCLVVASAELMELARLCSPGLPVLDALRAGSRRVRHVVFDMGGVLLEWNPTVIAQEVCASDEDARLLAYAVFESTEWAWQDAGAVDEETVAWTSKLRVPKRLHAAVDRLVYHWHDNRTVMPQTGRLISELKARGYGIYLLSNAGPAFERYKHRLPGYDCFDGMVVSCFEHVVKPDARIYNVLCERYGLEAKDCLFVDDLEHNVCGARRVGMQGWRFDGTVEGLRYHLLGT